MVSFFIRELLELRYRQVKDSFLLDLNPWTNEAAFPGVDIGVCLACGVLERSFNFIIPNLL